MKFEAHQTTHYCLKNLLTLAQIMGLFPLDNIRSSDPNKIEFRWCYWKVFYSIFMGLVYLIFFGFAFFKALTEGILINQLITPLFYLHSFSTSMSLLTLARKWPKFILTLSKIEEHLIRKYKSGRYLNKKLAIGAFFMISIAMIEHSLAVSNSILSTNCQNSYTGWEHHFKKQSHFLFRRIPYNFYAGCAFMIISWYGAFVWNFGDILIVLISIIMTARFKQITHKIKVYCMEMKGYNNVKEFTTNFFRIYHSHDSKAELVFWREIREDYNKMCQVIRSLDKLLSNLVLLSYTFNLTFILIQLFNSLRHMQSVIEGVYFYYSFGFVIARIVVVSIYGASVNEASQDPLYLLHSLPTEVYNEEIQRLITQVHIDSAALTGHNFFRITKGLVLSVAAAIITYELVLVQFNQTTIEKYMAFNDTICI